MSTRPVFKLFILAGLIVLTVKVGYSQQRFKGRIYESDIHATIGGVIVTNLRTKATTVSDSTGRFSIPASLNDLIAFKSFVFRSDTVMVIDFLDHPVYLTPLSANLSEVVVDGEKRQMNLGSLMAADYHGQTVVYQRNDDGSLRGGLTFRLSYWNKDNKVKRRSIKRMKDQEIYREIDKVFNPFTLKKYLPLNGNELADFIALYRPPLTVFMSKNFDLLLYINDSYKKYLDLLPDQRKLPALKAAE